MKPTHLPLSLLVLAACGARTPTPTPAPTPADHPATDDSRFGPLEIGADYLSYRKVTSEPFLSRVHGGRWVDVWVTPAAADAYVDGGDIPVGTVVVKDSWEDDGAGHPSKVRGPIYVMKKQAPGYAPDHEDWYFAIHWAEPTPDARATLGGPIYWRGRSPKVAYCYECHDSYDRDLGGLTPSSILPR